MIPMRNPAWQHIGLRNFAVIYSADTSNLYRPGEDIVCVTGEGSSTFTQRHTLAGWDLVTDAIDSRAFRRRFEKRASQAAHTPACVRGLENAHVVPVKKVYTYLQHCRATSVTGQIVANRLARSTGWPVAAQPEFQDFEIQARHDVSQPGCNTRLHPRRDYRVQGRAIPARQLKLVQPAGYPVRLGKHGMSRTRVRYLCSELMRVTARYRDGERKTSRRRVSRERILRRGAFSFLSTDRSSVRDYRVGQFSSLLRNRRSPLHEDVILAAR